MYRKTAFAVAALLLLVGCGSARTPQAVQFTKTAPADQIAPQSSAAYQPIRIAAASIVSPQETLKSYGKFFIYLGNKVGRPIELVQRKTYEETYNLLRDGTLDLAMVCTYVYVHGHDTVGLELLAAPVVGGRAEYQSLLLVTEASGATSLEDLRGKRFAFTDPLSASGRIYPLTLLKQQGLDPGTFFSMSTYTYSHDNSIKALVQGVVDGAAVDSLVYDQWAARNPELARKVKIIARSEAMPSPPIVASSRLDSSTREAFRQALLTMHQDPEGKLILAEMGIDQFAQLSDADYEPVRRMARLLGMLP
ncbi:MAG TPA: phosphate/phosphite/phosphonate ABC transporter substrate-binding protein [Symbiobacteriaceae bacterium]|nr:phosphate/phosphite/phosphonate ABC transporter substrate-binding protein [Symbiobacteriaceae bacterium]